MHLLRRLVTYVMEEVQESIFGTPVRLRKFVRRTPALRVHLNPPPQVTAADQIVHWHDWEGSWLQSTGTMQLWAMRGNGYTVRDIVVPALANFSQRSETPHWECEIQDVVGCSCSKSDLASFTTLDDLVTTNSRDMVDRIDDAKLQENLRHNQIHILRPDPDRSGDFFKRYLWDGGRIFWANSGGSHHFAAARYIARRLGRAIPLAGRLFTYSIDPAAATALLDEYHLFAIPQDLAHGENGLVAQMRALRAPVGLYSMPRPHESCQLILLPKASKLANKVAQVLHAEGTFNVSDYIEQAVFAQHRAAQRQPLWGAHISLSDPGPQSPAFRM